MTETSVIGPIRCPKCNEWVLKAEDSQRFVLRNRVTLFSGGTTVAICKRCSERVPIPVDLVA